MTVGVAIGVALVGGLGAVLRVVVTTAVSAREGHRLPWGTLVVNLSGAFVLGLLAGAGVSGTAFDLAGTGLLGGYTTFSTWMAETDRLAVEGHRDRAATYVALSLAAGLAAAALGHALGAAVRS
jgi:CrcB protein